jgi:hypothetical protein
MTENQRGRIDTEVKSQNLIKEKSDMQLKLDDSVKNLKLQQELVT